MLTDDIYRMLLTKYKFEGGEYNITDLLNKLYETGLNITPTIRQEIINIITPIIKTIQKKLNIRTKKSFKEILTKCRADIINPDAEIQEETETVTVFFTNVKDKINAKPNIDPNNYFTIENILP